MTQPDPDYPRWMFHRTRPMVMVQNADEEKALGPEWSRTLPAPEPPAEPEDAPKPAAKRHR